MSTGANCVFKEVKPGVWMYAIQRWPYGETEEYDRHGPFKTEQEAIDHMSANHTNPGGWWSEPYNAKAEA